MAASCQNEADDEGRPPLVKRRITAPKAAKGGVTPRSPKSKRHSAWEIVFESHIVLGFNRSMIDIQASMAREHLKQVPDRMTARRRRLAQERVAAGIKGACG